MLRHPDLNQADALLLLHKQAAGIGFQLAGNNKIIL